MINIIIYLLIKYLDNIKIVKKTNHHKQIQKKKKNKESGE